MTKIQQEKNGENKQFLEEGTKLVIKDLKRCLASLVILKLKFKFRLNKEVPFFTHQIDQNEKFDGIKDVQGNSAGGTMDGFGCLKGQFGNIYLRGLI